MNVDRIVVHAKRASIVGGAFVTLATVYTLATGALAITAGAVDARVDAKLQPVLVELRKANLTTTENRRETLDVKRGLLVNERFTLERQLNTADVAAKQVFAARINAINVELNQIEKKDDKLLNEVDRMLSQLPK